MAAETRRDVFQAIADPTRRRIIDLVANDSMSLNAIAKKFHVSRPAISQHIKILIDCGIIEIEKKGRERFCKIQPRSLVPAFMWMEQHHKQWEDRLGNFENYLNELQTKNKKPKK